MTPPLPFVLAFILSSASSTVTFPTPLVQLLSIKLQSTCSDFSCMDLRTRTHLHDSCRTFRQFREVTCQKGGSDHCFAVMYTTACINHWCPLFWSISCVYLRALSYLRKPAHPLCTISNHIHSTIFQSQMAKANQVRAACHPGISSSSRRRGRNVSRILQYKTHKTLETMHF